MSQDDIAGALIRRQERLAAERAALESQWQEIAELVSPMRAEFTLLRSPGEKRQQRVFDATPSLAAENLAAGLWGMVTNSANRWFELRSQDAEANELPAVTRWFEAAGERMRDALAANGLRFYTRAVDLYSDLVTFGTGVFYTEEIPETGALHFSCRHLAECFIAENDREQVDTLFRRFHWTARQAWQRWGEGCGEAIAKAAEKEPERRFPFLHAVLPRAEADRRRLDAKGMAFASYYLDLEGRKLLSEGGYPEFPYQVPRWSTRSRGLYGDSPAMLALPDIKMLNAMAKTTIVAAQKAADPPILAPDEMAVRGLRTTPGGIIYGGVDEQGRARYQPFQSHAAIGLGLELEEQRRQAIREAFHWSLLLMVAAPNQTATEVLARQEEKLRLMGPHLGRLQSEFLDPLLTRLFNTMLRHRRLPPPPEALVGRGGIKVEYVSPAAQAQRASEGTAIVRALQALTPLAQLKPEVFDNIDADATARRLAQAFGAPAALLLDPETVAALRAQRQQQAAMAQMAQAAPPIAGAVKDLAQAGVLPQATAALAAAAADAGGGA
ncbi:MAG: portal protein [Dongiaceae bacterium]